MTATGMTFLVDLKRIVLKLSEEELTHKEELKRQGWDSGRIADEVCRMLSVDPDDLHKKGRANGLICCNRLRVQASPFRVTLLDC